VEKQKIITLKALKNSGYKLRTVRDELRENLIRKMEKNEEIFPGIIGYEDTIIPDLQNAIFARHNFILLGLRGQAKSRILRSLAILLDDFLPVIAGSEINDNPFKPVSKFGRDLLKKYGDDTPIEWISREKRYNEKLATPDVSIADLIGDIDPIKAATNRLNYAHEESIHFGIIPRTNRGIFVINELPDLQPRIQVGLLNILEEQDLQIRGYPLRIPLDIIIAFTANPEDYTNRGNIITPLKDRIDSQIITHYPLNIENGIAITDQEAWQERGSINGKDVPYYFREIVESIAVEARENELIDQKSGVSARLPIACLELMISNAERRANINGQKTPTLRISDFKAVIPSITGKIELVYEGEQEGVTNVANILIGKGIKRVFEKYFPLPDVKRKDKKQVKDVHLEKILSWFSADNMISINGMSSDKEYIESFLNVEGLESFVKNHFSAVDLGNKTNLAAAKEFVLESLYQNSFLSKFEANDRITYKDLVGTIFNSLPEDEDERDINYLA
jgi:magnesium chelatase subunit I